MAPEVDINVNENDFFADFQQNTQEFEAPKEKTPEVLLNPENGIVQKAVKKTNNLAAKTLVNSADSLLALLLSLYALSDDIDSFKLDANDSKDLIELIESSMPTDKVFLPEWALILLGVTTIYGKKIKMASSERNENLKKRQIEEVKHKKELKEAENETD